MRVALEVCGEFLSRIGALEGANAIAEILRKTGVELPDTSPFRWRALLAAIRQELDAEPMDVVFLFERLLQLDATMPSGPSHKLFDSPLFFHLLVERFAVAFEGLDAELFKLESDELCHIDGIYETCLLIRDKIQETEPNDLRKFLETFEKIFEQDEPKDCWDAFYELYQLSDAPFRRDMKRALCRIEAVTLGPTKLELAFPSETAPSPKKVIPRALLEKRFGGTRREWGDLSQINSISRVGIDHPTDYMQEQQDNQEQEAHEADTTVNGQSTESVHSDISEEAAETEEVATPEQPASSRPPRAAETARANRQQGRRAISRTRLRHEGGTPREGGTSTAPEESGESRRGGRRKRIFWSAEEEAALIEGYRLFESYSNVWMLTKSRYPDVLHNRSNVDLKDKYRNLVKYGKIPPVEGDDNTGITDNDVTDDNADADANVGENEH